MTDTKTVNGQRFDKFSTGGDKLAREFCAALPRGGHPAIHSVANRGGSGVVTLHLNDSVDTKCERLEIPDGFRVKRASVTNGGGHFLAVVREGDQ